MARSNDGKVNPESPSSSDESTKTAHEKKNTPVASSNRATNLQPPSRPPRTTWSQRVAQLGERLDHRLNRWLGTDRPNFETRRVVFAAVVWGAISCLAAVVRPSAKAVHEAEAGDAGLWLWYNVSVVITQECASLCITVLFFRAGCGCGDATEQPTVAASSSSAAAAAGSVAPSLPPAAAAATTTVVAASSSAARTGSDSSAVDSMVLDAEVCAVTGQWYLLYVLLYTTTITLLGYEAGFAVAMILNFPTVLRLMSRAAVTRWGAEPGHASHLMWFLGLRILLPGVPLIFAPQMLVPPLIQQMSVGTLMAGYPHLLSLFEFLIVSVLYSDRAVSRLNERQLAWLARAWAGTLEASKVGLLVVVANHTGDVEGLIWATLSSVLSETATRTNAFPTIAAACRYCVSVVVHWLKRHPGPPPTWKKPELGRFDRMYLSAKHESELWPFYTLLLLKLLHVATPTAIDPDTGDLLPELDCSWTVLAIVLGGELAGDVLSRALLWAEGRWAPALRPDVLTRSVQPSSSSPLVTTLVFLQVAYMCQISIGGMGELVLALREQEQQQGH